MNLERGSGRKVLILLDFISKKHEHPICVINIISHQVFPLHRHCVTNAKNHTGFRANEKLN